MFSSFQRLWWRAALFRLVVRHPEAVFNDKYARAVEKTSHQLEKRYGTRRGLSSTQRFSSHNDRSTSSLNVIDKSTNSTPEYQGHDIKQEKSRKKNLSLPTVYLPSELQAALDNAMSKHPRWSLVEDGQAISKYLMMRNDKRKKSKSEHSKNMLDALWKGEGMKAKKGHMESTLNYGKREAMAYAASRIQASYGIVKRVLSEIASQEPSFKPETVLDFGSGLGTVPWATHQLWSDSVYEYQCVDISQWMGDLAKTLRTGGEVPETTGLTAGYPKEYIPEVYFKQYLPVSNKIQYDLVVAAHTLGDLPSSKLRRLSVASLWRKTKQFLVLIELGNWTGFEIIRGSREFVLEASTKWTKYNDETDKHLEGHVFAPCPHDLSCPLGRDSKKPCHFAQRVQLALCEKDGPLRHKGYRQENFSYVVLKKGKRESQSSVARVLQPVRKRTRHIICDLCTPEGEAKRFIFTKSKHGAVYKEGRQSEWGDTLPMPQRNGSNTQECGTSTDSQQEMT